MTAHLNFLSYCVLDLTEGMRGSIQRVTDMQTEAKGKCPDPQMFPVTTLPFSLLPLWHAM